VLSEALLHTGVLVNILLSGVSVSVLLLGLWIWRDQVAFWDQFNPYLKPYSRFTLRLGRVIGSLWAFGAIVGCILFLGNAVQAALQHHWIR
jgi:hypothetical protein